MIPSALLADTVTLESYEGAGAHGPIFGAKSEICVRLEPRRRLLKRGDGVEVISAGVLFARPNVAIKAEDRVTCEGRTYRVLDVATQKAGRRSVFLEVILG